MVPVTSESQCGVEVADTVGGIRPRLAIILALSRADIHRIGAVNIEVDVGAAHCVHLTHLGHFLKENRGKVFKPFRAL